MWYCWNGKEWIPPPSLTGASKKPATHLKDEEEDDNVDEEYKNDCYKDYHKDHHKEDQKNALLLVVWGGGPIAFTEK